jgi:glucosamine--fructose-6-phosphate aminotransferase (isomerizing)
MARRAERYRFMEHAVVLGRGLNYASAFEFALKLMETCYVVAERFSSADFLHGPIAMVERNFPVFVFAPSGATWNSIDETLGKLEHLTAETVIITDPGNIAAMSRGTRVIRLPRKLPELYTPIPYIIPAQMFAACLAEQKGLDPDKPRTISKVTLTM